MGSLVENSNEIQVGSGLRKGNTKPLPQETAEGGNRGPSRNLVVS